MGDFLGYLLYIDTTDHMAISESKFGRTWKLHEVNQLKYTVQIF